MKRGNIGERDREYAGQVSEEESDAEREFLSLCLQLRVAEAQIDGVRSDAEGGKRTKKGKGVGGGCEQEDVCPEDARQQKQSSKKKAGKSRHCFRLGAFLRGRSTVKWILSIFWESKKNSGRKSQRKPSHMPLYRAQWLASETSKLQLLEQAGSISSISPPDCRRF